MYEWSTGTINMGWYTGLLQMFKYNSTQDALTALLPQRLRDKMGLKTTVPDLLLFKKDQAIREMLTAVASYYLYEGMRSTVMNSDDDELSWYEVMALRALVKTANESRSLVPLPGYGKPMDYINTFTTFTTMTSEFKQAYNLLMHMYGDLIGDPDAYYLRQAGTFDKGDAKWVKDFQGVFGIDNILNISPESGYHRLKEQVKSKN
jgi:hypothetical protein